MSPSTPAEVVADISDKKQCQQRLDFEMQSPNEMLVDPDEYVVDVPGSEKDDEAVSVFPEQLNNGRSEEAPTQPLANDYEAMKEFVLTPLLEEPEILADAVHTWEIEGWRSLNKKEHGPIFEAGGFPWRVLMFPFGNNVDSCSFYLEQGFADGKTPEDWYCCVQFSLVLWNPNDPSIFVHHTAHHRFTKEEGDWGFTRFAEIRKLYNTPWLGASRPMIENEAANMTAYVRVVKDETGVLWHNFINYDSKKETGFVGLKNQGATCYLNSLLQSLYFTDAFRTAVYQIPTQNEDSLQNSAYTLQRLFYQLQTSNTAVSTNELTKSFGWETRHIFEQQDVQELSRKLMERLEEKMKGTEAQNVLPKLFSGKQKTYISCINVPYESSRVEDFWDVQLNVSGNKNIEESFRDYIQVEKMDGENQYFAGEQYKLQDANKGVIFQSFPDVLHLQLKRFEYDIERDAMTKINDRYEFPEIFDATPYLSDDADKSQPYTYQLHSVLVHSGDLNAGHYYAFIKPTKNGIFYKYDDDKVTRATMREVLEDNFGGEIGHTNGHVKGPFQKPNTLIRQNSAYMLVYIRRSAVDEVLFPVTKQDTPPHLQRKLEEEAFLKESRRREREEQHLYLLARIVTDETYHAHAGTDLAMWDDPEKNPAAARSYRLLKTSTIEDLTNRVAEDFREDPRKIRFWCMVNRQNKTIRPDQPILDSKMTVDEVHLKLAGTKLTDLRLWAEVADEVDSAGEPVWPALVNHHPGGVPKSETILLFLKWFDVEHQVLRGAGHIYIGKERKVEELVPQILKKMGWPEKTAGSEKLTQLKLYEEIKPQMIDAMKAKQTLKAAELQDGDIVCFQKAPEKSLHSESDSGSTKSTKQSGWIEDAQLFYDYLLHRKVIKLFPHPKSESKREPFDIELSAKFTYDQIAAKIGEKLDVDPTHLRFHTMNSATSNPKAAVKRNATQTLQSILIPPYSTFGNNNQRSDALFFEVLDISLSEFDTKKNLKITWLSEGITKEELFDVLVPKNGNVGDLIAGLIRKAQLEDESQKGLIRVYETHNNKVYKELPRDYTVMSITDYISLVAERIPEEEINSDPGHFIYAFHFQNEPNKPHGVPFRFHIKADENFAETKKRLEKRTGIKGKAFEKIKFAVVKRGSYSKPYYLADDDILWDVAASDDDLLGLDHIDRTRQLRNGAGDLFLR